MSNDLGIYRHKCTEIKTRKKYSSIMEASNKTNIDKDYILNCCIWYRCIELNEFSRKHEWMFTNHTIGYGENR